MLYKSISKYQDISGGEVVGRSKRGDITITTGFVLINDLLKDCQVSFMIFFDESLIEREDL